jgi:hypothetical protein
MVRYQLNNIIFRIASSDAISKFKAIQAHTFVQLARKDLSFDESTKEAVLLEYDRFSQWLFRIERICMAAQEGNMAPSLRSAIQESCAEELRTIENVLESYPDVFGPNITTFDKLIHAYSAKSMRTRMDKCMTETVEKAFEQLVQIVSDYLQHVLICLHEMNNNYINKAAAPFVCIANFCSDSDNIEERYYPIRKRVEFFMALGCGDTYLLKDYTDRNLYEEAKEYVQQFGINLVRKQETEEAQHAFA